MVEYHIYEIPGVKIGCTTDMVRRQKAQRDKGEMVLLESHTCIEEATRRERELQLGKGYPTDVYGYKGVMKAQKKASSPKYRAKAARNTDYKSIDHVKAKESYMIPVKAFTVKTTGRKYCTLYDKKYIGTYRSISECGKALGINPGGIRCVLNPNFPQKSSKGYTFEYV